MPDYPRPRRILTRAGTEEIEAPYVPELSPVTDRQALLMTRPWLEWCRHVAGFIQHGGGGGGGTGTGDVVGPSTSTDDAIAVYNGTTGKIIKDSLKTIAALTTDIINSILPGGKLPTANLPVHHVTHEPGGSDALAALSATILTSGTLPDARLSANVARLDQFNYYTDRALYEHANPTVYFRETDQIDSNSDWEQVIQDQKMNFWSLTAGGAVLAAPLTLERDGDAVIGKDLTVTGQVIAAGLDGTPLNATNLTSGTVPDARLSANVQMKPTWQDVTFNAANFSVIGGASWPVTAGQVLLNHYRLVGKSLLWVLAITAAGPVTGGTQLLLVPPIMGAKDRDGQVRVALLMDASGRPDCWAYMYPSLGGVLVEKYNTGIPYSGLITLQLSIEYEVP